jgi:hypothetical protein
MSSMTYPIRSSIDNHRISIILPTTKSQLVLRATKKDSRARLWIQERIMIASLTGVGCDLEAWHQDD